MKRRGSLLSLVLAISLHAAEASPKPVEFAQNIASSRTASAEEKKRLLALLGSKDQEVVSMAAYAIGQLGDASPEVLQALANNLDAGAKSEATRSVCAVALLRLGEPGRAVLRQRAESAESVVDRVAAITALRADLPGLKDPGLRGLMKKHFRDIDAAVNPLPFPPAEGSPIRDGGFEVADFSTDWTVEKTNGGEGTVTFDPGQSHGGGGSLRMEKTNAAGEIALRSVRPLRIKAGTAPVVRLYFRSDDAPMSTGLHLLFERADGKFTGGDPVRGWVPMGQTLMRNQPPGEWSKRLIVANKSEKDEDVYLRIVLRGNPATVWIDDIGAPAPSFTYAQTVPTETLVELGTEEKSKEPSRAEFRREGDRVRLVINGEVVPPILYNILRSSFGDYAGMEDLGKVPLMVSLVAFTDIVDRRYPPVTPVWREGTEFDFTTPLAWLEATAKKAPNSSLVLNLQFCWPKGWVDANPSEAWIDKAGNRGYGTGIHLKGFIDKLPGGMDPRLPESEAAEFRWWPSPFSEAALRDAEEGLRQFVAILKTKPYANRVVGAHISGGHDLQFMTANWPDFSPPAVAAFRRWLGVRYGTDAALQAAWGDPAVTLANVTIPEAEALVKLVKQEKNLFLSPLAGRRFVDHQQFQAEQGLVIRERLAEAFKRAWERPAFAMTWQMGGGRGQGVETIFLDSPGLDMLVPQPQYETRLPGNVGGLRSTPLASFALHGKVAVKEMDLRTWLRMSGAEVQSFYLGAAMNPQSFRQIFRREAAQMIAAGQGYWFLDLATSGFRDPDMMEAIGEGYRAYRELEIDNPTPVRPEVALVWVDASPYWLADYFKDTSKALGGTSVSILQTVERFTLSGLKQSGVPYADIYLSDLLKGENAAPYKVLVFPDAFRLTEAQRREIHEKLARQGRTLVWNYAAGYVTDTELSDEAVGKLTGIAVKSETAELFPRVRFGEDAFTKGLQGMVGTGELAMTMMSENVPNWRMPRGFRRFVVADEDAVPLAQYEDGRTAVAMKKFPEWTSVYFGMLGTLDGGLLNRIAHQAGALVLADTPVAVEFNGRFLSLHGVRNGPVTVHLPTKSRVFDFDTGQEVAHDRDVTLDLRAGDTRWFRVEPDAAPVAGMR